MDFTYSDRQRHWTQRVETFLRERVWPEAATYDAQLAGFGADRWRVIPVVQRLKAEAKAAGTLAIADGPDEVHNRTIARLEFKKHEPRRNAS